MQQPYSNDAPRRPGVTPMAAVTTGLLSERLRRAAPCPRTAALTAALEMVARARARTAPAPTSIDFPAWPQRPNLYGQMHPKICINVPTDKQCNDVWAAGKPGRDYLRYYKGASWGGRVAEAQPKADTVLDGEEAVGNEADLDAESDHDGERMMF
jgi:hypothetical protein